MFLKLKLQSLNERKKETAVPWATGIQDLDSQAFNYLYRISPAGSHSLLEFVLTPFRVTLWTDLWYVDLVNKEEIGIVARFSEFMREREINIVSMYSNTTWGGRRHTSRIAIDCRDYKLEGDPGIRQSSPRAELRSLKRELSVTFIKEIVLLPQTQPSISIERDQSLWSLCKVSKHLLDTSEKVLSVFNGYFTIPSEEIERFVNNYSVAFGISKAELGEAQALISLDPQSDVLRITIFFKGFGIVPAMISIEDQPGAIAAVTEALALAGFNILASRAFMVRQSRMCLWLLLDSGSRDRVRTSDQITSDKVREVIYGFPQAGEYRPMAHPLPLVFERRFK